MVDEAVQLTVEAVAEALSGEVRGDADRVLTGVATLPDATESDLSFLHRPEYRALAEQSAAGCIVVGPDADLGERTVVVTPDPHRAFASAIALFHPSRRPAAGISPDATIDERARVDATAHVGARAVVGAGSAIGAGCVVEAGVIVAADCVVGDGSWLHPGCVLLRGTVLGARVIVHSGAVLGADGFGYSSGPDGHVKVPHVGRVVVEDDVEIGAGACIDRAVLGETRIGAGTKIDNLVQVAHNVKVGRGCLLVAQSGVSGSTTLGEGCVLAGQAGVAGHLSVGDGARVAAKSAVFADVPAGETVGGIPAVRHARWRRTVAALSRLPEALRRLRRLEGADDGDET